MAIFLIKDSASGLALNVIEKESEQDLVLPEGQELVALPEEPVGVWMGWRVVGETWVPPVLGEN